MRGWYHGVMAQVAPPQKVNMSSPCDGGTRLFCVKKGLTDISISGQPLSSLAQSTTTTTLAPILGGYGLPGRRVLEQQHTKPSHSGNKRLKPVVQGSRLLSHLLWRSYHGIKEPLPRSALKEASVPPSTPGVPNRGPRDFWRVRV